MKSHEFDRSRLRIIGSRQLSANQGHNLLAYYLGKSSWRISGWHGALWQRALASLLRRFPRYQSQRPALAYNLFLANWLSQFGFVHLIWGDHTIKFLDRPERCILTLHQPYEFWTESEWGLLGKCAGIVCMAERECRKVIQRYPHLPCVFIPHGVDTTFWHVRPAPPKFQICAVGRHLRNFTMLLRVARVLLERHQDLDFYWVVNPDYKLSPELLSQLPPERFKILRNLSSEELHLLYVESWLFCTPYENIAASNAVVESMASGTPIFTTRVGGMASYDDGDVITMVENNDDAALVAAVTRCLTSPAWRADLAARGRAHAVKYFDWPRVIAAHETFYHQVVQARAHTADSKSEGAAGAFVGGIRA